jgi:chaperone BCS1
MPSLGRHGKTKDAPQQGKTYRKTRPQRIIQNNEDTAESNDLVLGTPIPTTLASWVIGVLNGDENAWFMDFVESDVFEDTRHIVKLRTGIDVDWLVAACIAIHSTAHNIPKMMNEMLEQVKSQTTSSITIGSADSAIQTGILRYMRTRATPSTGQEESTTAAPTKTVKSWLTFHGQHDIRNAAGVLKPSPDSFQRFFWYEDTLFMLDLAKDKQAPATWDEDDRGYVQAHKMRLRCFGHSNNPINDFIQYIKAQSEISLILDVHTVAANEDTMSETRQKRPMATIDMEPCMRENIKQIVTDFFHPGTLLACKASGAPHRLGFLLSGPPGTGKTSLSVAVASHASVPLALVNLQGMDDYDLAKAFSSLPSSCVVLLEDIDASSAAVKERGRGTERTSDQAMLARGQAVETNDPTQSWHQTLLSIMLSKPWIRCSKDRSTHCGACVTSKKLRAMPLLDL